MSKKAKPLPHFARTFRRGGRWYAQTFRGEINRLTSTARKRDDALRMLTETIVSVIRGDSNFPKGAERLVSVVEADTRRVWDARGRVGVLPAK